MFSLIHHEILLCTQWFSRKYCYVFIDKAGYIIMYSLIQQAILLCICGRCIMMNWNDWWSFINKWTWLMKVFRFIYYMSFGNGYSPVTEFATKTEYYAVLLLKVWSPSWFIYELGCINWISCIALNSYLYNIGIYIIIEFRLIYNYLCNYY